MKEGQKQRIYSSRRKEKEREENTKGNWVRRELGKRKKKTRKSRSLKLLSQKWRNSEKKICSFMANFTRVQEQQAYTMNVLIVVLTQHLQNDTTENHCGPLSDIEH